MALGRDIGIDGDPRVSRKVSALIRLEMYSSA